MNLTPDQLSAVHPRTRLARLVRAAVCACAALAAGVASVGQAADSQVGVAGALDKATAEKAFPAQRPYSPYVGANLPTRPYFGDTHLHTSYSMDAGAFGARLTPRDACVFAKGNEIKFSSGQPVKLSRPLDFLVVADHSDGMGFFPLIMSGSPEILADPQGRKWHEMILSGQGAAAAIDIIQSFGKTAPQEPSPERMTSKFFDNPQTGVKIMDWEVSASGYAAVWATENTREALFDAMERRGTYATTGTRMVVRFFGGWDFEPKDAGNRQPATVGYAKGVPMGGDLRAAPAGKSPTFLVAALKDPLGANVDRIQSVKGWLDARGTLQEQVYDVAWGDADKRKPGADGKVPAVGSTVDVANASWTNTIGDPELITVWKDPAFDPKQRAFYYARVLEIPTPRWTAHDAKRFGVQPLPGTTMTLQERAYTSPIWYTPGG